MGDGKGVITKIGFFSYLYLFLNISKPSYLFKDEEY